MRAQLAKNIDFVEAKPTISADTPYTISAGAPITFSAGAPITISAAEPKNGIRQILPRR